MKMIMLLTVVTMVSTGCRTQAFWAERSYQPRGGVVQYPNGGFESNFNKRVIDAREKMADFCAPDPYQVTKESFSLESSGSITSFNPITKQAFTTDDSEEHTYIRFACTPTKQSSN